MVIEINGEKFSAAMINISLGDKRYVISDTDGTTKVSGFHVFSNSLSDHMTITPVSTSHIAIDQKEN